MAAAGWNRLFTLNRFYPGGIYAIITKRNDSIKPQEDTESTLKGHNHNTPILVTLKIKNMSSHQ